MYKIFCTNINYKQMISIFQRDRVNIWLKLFTHTLITRKWLVFFQQHIEWKYFGVKCVEGLRDTLTSMLYVIVVWAGK